MSSADPIQESLMAPGAPFEVVERGPIRIFKHAPDAIADILNQGRNFGQAEFIVQGGQRLTYDAFFTRADALSDALVSEHGVKPGQSVAICMKNSPEWMIAFVAILNAGAVTVLVNSRGTGEVMTLAISDANSVLVLADEQRVEKLIAAGCGVPLIKGESFPKTEVAFEGIARGSDDLAAMFFTSGTTGRAKAAAISNRALITGMMNTQMAMAAVFMKMAKAYNIDVETMRAQMPQSCSLLVFPLFHTSGCSAVFMTALTTGGKLVLMDRWDAEGALHLIETERVTTFGGVPTMYWDVLRCEKLKDYDLSSLMGLSVGGQALPQNLLAEMRTTFPKAFIGAGYGMTETCGAISQANGEVFLANPEASGQVLPMVDVQISSEDGQALAIGEVGEIWAKGATLMEGYYGRPQATAAAMSGEWFKTGDIGRLDKNGFIYVVDRKTDMVISGGENIYCAEVEQIMGRHPHILAVGTFGVSDDRLGERLVASARVVEGADAEDILSFAKDNLATYKVPTELTVQTDPFEMNAMGKIQKHILREAYLTRKKKEQGA